MLPLSLCAQVEIPSVLHGYWENENNKTALVIFDQGITWIDLTLENKEWYSSIPSTSTYSLVDLSKEESTYIFSVNHDFFKKNFHKFFLELKSEYEFNLMENGQKDWQTFSKKEPPLRLETYFDFFSFAGFDAKGVFSGFNLNGFMESQELPANTEKYLVHRLEDFG
ncbi:MAG: hypothetical protein AAF696_17045, partial [Bacteroidota bacterium]